MKIKQCPKCSKPKPINESRKDDLRVYCKVHQKEIDQEYKAKYSCKYILHDINQRCNNANNKRYKDYGLRGIKYNITSEELEFLWYRDKAYEMKKPSIDRKNNNESYELNNCRFIELKENSGKDNKGKCVFQFNLDNQFIKKWNSQTEAFRETGIIQGNISKCANNKLKTAGGFVWRHDK